MPKRPIERKVYPSHSVTLQRDDGTEVAFRLTLNNDALIRVEEKTGVRLLQRSILMELGSLKVTSAAIWGAICENHPEYESDEGLRSIRSLLGEDENLAKATEALWESYLLCQPAKRREALKRFLEEAEKGEGGAGEDPTTPSKPTTASTETSTGSSSQPSPGSTSESVRANSAS